MLPSWEEIDDLLNAEQQIDNEVIDHQTVQNHVTVVNNCDLHGKLDCDIDLCRSQHDPTHPHFRPQGYARRCHPRNETRRQWLPGVQENTSHSLVVRAPSPGDEFDQLYPPWTTPATQHHSGFSDEAHVPVFAMRPSVHGSPSRAHQEFSHYEDCSSRPWSRNDFSEGSEYEASAQHRQGNFIHIYALNPGDHEETDEAGWSYDHAYDHGRAYGEESAHTPRLDHARGYYPSTLYKAVDAADKQATYNLIEKLQAENQILKHQVAGYEEVLKYKERRKKKSRSSSEAPGYGVGFQ